VRISESFGYTRRTAGGLTAGIGEGRPKISTKKERGLTQSASTLDEESVEGLTSGFCPRVAAKFSTANEANR